MSRSDNIVAYWGGNADEDRLSAYCDATVNVITISTIIYQGEGQLPTMLDMEQPCGQAFFANTQLAYCPDLATDITHCQSKGIAVMVSLDSGNGTDIDWYGSESRARAYANLLWDLFLGGQSISRPFGDAQLDGVDFPCSWSDFASGCKAFLDQLQSHFQSDTVSRPYYSVVSVFCSDITSSGLITANLDAIYVAVHTGACSVAHYGDDALWNYGSWDSWVTSQADSDALKLYLLVPASATFGVDYVNPDRLAYIAMSTAARYPAHFGGIVYFDAAAAAANNGFQKSLRHAFSNVSHTSSLGIVPAVSTLSFSPVKTATSTSAGTASVSPTSSPTAPSQAPSFTLATAQETAPGSLASSKASKSTLVIAIVVAFAILVLAGIISFISVCIYRRRKRKVAEAGARLEGEEESNEASEPILRPFYAYPQPSSSVLDSEKPVALSHPTVMSSSPGRVQGLTMSHLQAIQVRRDSEDTIISVLHGSPRTLKNRSHYCQGMDMVISPVPLSPALA
ncbi:glycoside hydrolase [Exidia glandulosa HHB12029]|uniref:Glycoside hydrolase n=1 Tax=Exidia glandulosa HHB12029 TaxID=1314781 RepID=A0A165LUV6_EXIGL|nr:glycoside hydrolase [Exidia glandulosa HHB12029]